MKILILLITGGVIGFLAGFAWKYTPATESWRANRDHFWSQGGRPGGAEVTGLLSGAKGRAFASGTPDVRRVLLRAYAIAPGRTRVVVTQWRPEGQDAPVVELAKEVEKRAKTVAHEGPTHTVRVEHAGKTWLLSVDIYRVDADNAVLTGDDFINLPQRVYFDETLYRGLPVQPEPGGA